MKKVTRTLALLLTLCTLVSCLSIFVSADSVIGNVTISPITEMNELNARAAINTYFNQRKDFLTGEAESIPVVNIPMLNDETRHRTHLYEAGIAIINSTIAFGELNCWDSFFNSEIEETVVYMQNNTEYTVAITHTVEGYIGDSGVVVVSGDGYYESFSQFESCSYVNESISEIQATTDVTGGQECWIHRLTSELGYSETSSGKNKFTNSTDDWCAAFLRVCAREVNLPESTYPQSNWVPYLYEHYSGMNKYYKSEAYGGTYTPKRGDLFFYYDTPESPDHVGIIISVSSTTIMVLEGNWGDQVVHRTINRDCSSLVAYASPVYPSISHVCSAGWNTDNFSHWKTCDLCNIVFYDEALHSFSSQHNAVHHWQKCSVCSYENTKVSHSFTTRTNSTSHWQQCSCGYKKSVEAHTFMEESPEFYVCTKCGYSTYM